MFRLSHYMQQLSNPTPPRQAAAARFVPVVIWNLTRRCNLKCRHCYAVAGDRHFPGELTSEEAIAVLDDLAAFRIPALILSGGEPLSRPDTLGSRAALKSTWPLHRPVDQRYADCRRLRRPDCRHWL